MTPTPWSHGRDAALDDSWDLPPAARCTVIALGANLGDPVATLTAVRPRLSQVLPAPTSLRWSPLFRTAPVGGPPGQPPYVNAVVLASGPPPADPLSLLLALQLLEAEFGRQRLEPWGPRSLDLDLLWCGLHRRESAALWLPHPRYRSRAFVLAPLACIDAHLVPPDSGAPDSGAPGSGAMGSGASVAELLRALADPSNPEPAPQRLAPCPGWPE